MNPECQTVTGSQTLTLANQRTATLVAWLGDQRVDVPPGEIRAIEQPFSAYLQPGVHIVHIGTPEDGGPTVLVQ